MTPTEIFALAITALVVWNLILSFRLTHLSGLIAGLSGEVKQRSIANAIRESVTGKSKLHLPAGYESEHPKVATDGRDDS